MAQSSYALSDFLQRLTRRSPLSSDEQGAVLDLQNYTQRIRAHIDIIRPADTTDHATLVSDGLIARYDSARNGRRQLTAVYLRGDMCNLNSVVAPAAAWGFTSLTASTVLQIPHTELRRLARSYPGLAVAFWRDTTADASILSKWAGNLGRRDARARFAHLVCEMGLRMEAAKLGDRDCYSLDVNQTQLAEVLGLTAVHVNRTFQGLRREGLVTTNARLITIPDWQRLCDAAEFDPTYLLLRN